MIRGVLMTGLLLGTAWAAPFEGWVQRIASCEVDAVSGVVPEGPLFARVWWGGHLVAQARGDGRARAVALALSDDVAVVALRGLSPEALEAAAGRIQRAASALRRGEATARALARLEGVAEAHAVVYALLFEAWKARARYAGWGDPSEYIAAARRVATVVAVLGDDLTPWRAIAAWLDEAIVPDRNLRSLPRMEARGMNALLKRQPRRAARHLRAAWYAGAREPLAAIWLVAAAAAEEQAGRSAAASAARRRALAAIRAGPRWVQIALRVRIYAAAKAAGDIETARAAAASVGGAWRGDPLTAAVFEGVSL